ncbi:hypothetical protein EPN52_01185 [bacterium]|nr:MAG: hypothetical protein EPN52_01185 [bacterium]
MASRDAAVPALGLALVALYWLQERLFAGQVTASAQRLAYGAQLPVHVIPQGVMLAHGAAWSLVLLALLMGAVLYLLYRSLAAGAPSVAARGGLLLAFAAMLLIDLRSSTAMSNDAYAYIGYGVLPSLHAAYAPEAVALRGEFSAINQIWGMPLVPCIYGPLWLEGIRVALSGVHTLAQAWLAIRLFNVIALVALIVLVYALTRAPGAVAVVALNPALHDLFVVDAHNDLGGIVLVAAALLSYRKGWRLVALVLIVCAGLVKLPLVALGLLLLFYEPVPARRLAAGVALLGLTLVAYAAWAGPSYFASLLSVTRADAAPAAAHITAAFRGFVTLHAVLLAIAVLGIALAVVRRQLWDGARWSYIALGGAVYPWYLLWAFPSVLLAPRRLVEYAVALPLLALLLEHTFSLVGRHGTVSAALAVIVIAAIYEGLRAQTAAGWGSSLGTSEPSRKAGNSSTENWTPVVNGPNSA